jgi:hypothetical protein
VVDGIAYRWLIRRKPTYHQATGDGPLTMAIQRDDGTGTVLMVATDRARPDNWMGADSAVITPKTVASVIRKAQRDGWPKKFALKAAT